MLAMGDRRKQAGGFTLLELVIVIVILAILAGLAVPRYVRTVNRSRANEALEMLLQIRSSCERFYARQGSYATIAADLSNLDFDPTQVSGTAQWTYVASGQAADAYIITGTFAGAGGGTVLLTKAAAGAATISGTGQFAGI